MGVSEEKLREQMTPVYGLFPFDRLRWRLDFANARTRYGGWNRATQDIRDMAAFINKNGLIRACIEAERISHWVSRPLVEVDGQDFASFSWEMAATMPGIGFAKAKINSYTAPGHVIGLSILTRDRKITGYIDGQVKSRPLSESEKGFNLEEHKAGG